MKKNAIALFCAALCAAALTACSKSDGSSRPAETTTAQTTTTTIATTTTAASAATTTTAAATTSAAETTDPAEGTDGTTTAAQSENNAPAKILWSERGLEAVPAESEDGYGEPLTIGAEYLGWTLKSYDAELSGDSVSRLTADFGRSAALSTNGILTVLASTDADNPNGLYLRVDNQAEFPYFPKDTRERGYFIIENADEVFKWLELDEPPVSASYTVAVMVDVTKLHVDYSAGGYDKIMVTSASKR